MADSFSGDVPDLTGLIQSIPEGYNLSKLAVRSKEGWAMVVEANQRRNPIYPFTDYYWAWYSAHALLFRVLAASLPEADVYHAVSTGFAGLAAYASQSSYGETLSAHRTWPVPQGTGNGKFGGVPW